VCEARRVRVETRSEPFDGPAAQALIDEVQREYVRRYGSPDGTPVDPAEFAPPGGHFVVVYLDGAPAACGGWRRHGDDAEIKRMYVAPHARGHGLARRVLAELEAAAAAAGVRRVILETGTRQPEAMALYESSGYARIPGFGVYRDEPSCRCYAKSLAPRGGGVPGAVPATAEPSPVR
jgi:GNAT superfamily N-acetyltransferase